MSFEFGVMFPSFWFCISTLSRETAIAFRGGSLWAGWVLYAAAWSAMPGQLFLPRCRCMSCCRLCLLPSDAPFVAPGAAVKVGVFSCCPCYL
eukprot:3561566-Pyramimonas_sp.AAC.1